MDNGTANAMEITPILTANATETTPIFGLRYLEEEAVEIHDVVGCLVSSGGGLTCSCIDDGE